MLSKRKILAVHLSIWDVGFGMLSCLVDLLFFLRPWASKSLIPPRHSEARFKF